MASTCTPPRRSASSSVNSKMPRAMESSCMGRCSGMMEGGHGRLSQTDATVVGRDAGVRPDPNALRLELGLNVMEQHFILEDSTREHRSPSTLPLREHPHRGAQALRHASLKGANDGCGLPAMEAIVDNSR